MTKKQKDNIIKTLEKMEKERTRQPNPSKSQVFINYKTGEVRLTHKDMTVTEAYKTKRNHRIIAAYDKMSTDIYDYEKFKRLGKKFRLSPSTIRKIVKERVEYFKIK